MERFGIQGTLSRVGESGFVNMEEGTVFFRPKKDQTLIPKGDRPIVKRMKICLSCASDGDKLPLMFVFKWMPGEQIVLNINDELPDGTFGGCGEKELMDERTCRVCFKKI
uniref:AlNc14C24G2417 protein n=1 Tax=Albugo laibachii Nc14 TaxID=890382 RepID=F0W6B8_9STRA|nr:AlNc14C24G2417 [Albugo laibachii Nc14]|eukprot:CCA16661.1 AlNc14C24G2417 [Albugo laibachii Nc14]